MLLLFNNIKHKMFNRIIRRYIHLSSPSRNVRVRFAPSPTGYIHLGGLRTALYNYLFAKANDGKFILRIEDTDQKRLVPGAAEQLEIDLNWMGLIPDESPLKGGDFGPYTQSQRLHLYRKYSEELVKHDYAYYCFCSDRRLEAVKKEALRDGAIPRYDNRCRQLSGAQVKEKQQQGKPFCIRFKLTSLDNPLEDIVYGDVDRNSVLHEGDPVIMKQDGYPTYHLANVVDDHLMEITHVLRGTEWLVSTPKHVLLFNAFGWKPPSYAHLPLIMNSDGTKLSKRQDDIRLDFFRTQGFYPEAIVGLLSLVGGGFLSSIDIQQSLYSLTDLSKSFNLGNITTHSGRLDMLRLEYFNRLAFKDRMSHPNKREELEQQLLQLVHQTQRSESGLDEEMITETGLGKVLTWALNEGRIHLLKQLTEPSMGFLWSRQKNPVVTKIDLNTARSVITRVVQIIDGKEHVERNEISALLRDIAFENNLKVKELMKLMRSSLTGLKEGPPVGEIMEILGPRISASRLRCSMGLLTC